MSALVDYLADAPSGSLSVTDVADLFGVELVRAESGSEEKFVNDTTETRFRLEVFVLPNGEFRLSVMRLHGESISDWHAKLREYGWGEHQIIRHPFVQDTYFKNGRQIRLEHDGAAVLTITVFGLNISGDAP